MTILFSLKISEQDQERLTTHYPSEDFIFCPSMDEAKHKIDKAEVIVTYGSDLDETLIASAKKLQWVCVLSAGLDQLPFQALKEKDVLVTNVKGIHKVPMAEYAISMLLSVYRHERLLMIKQQQHVWDRTVKPLEISGKTMLIAGTGAIGQEVARLAQAFNIKTIGVSKHGRSVEFFDETVTTSQMTTRLPEADFVVSVLPSTVETKNIYTFDVFQAMKNEAVFLNMGRGDAVENDVILKAVQEEEIMHAVLDVFEQEPLPEDHPLWDADNITITPHLSGISPYYLPRALDILEKNLDVYMKGYGEFVNKIDVSRGY